MRIQNNPQLCPNCKTGYDSYLLDNRSPFCPYLQYHNGESCKRFIPINVPEYDIEIDREVAEDEE